MIRRPKVFCIGFQKTGTTSLHAALTMLGYNTASVVGRGLSADQLRAQALSLCIATAEKVDAAQDMPWPLFFRELDRALPGSKFVLTVRDPDAWFASVERHFGDRPDAMQEFVYGAAAPAGQRDRYLSVYKDHEAAVRRYFDGRPADLLVMDLEAGDGWDTLCAFLGAPTPRHPFPEKNRTRDRTSLLFRARRRIAIAFGRYIAPEQI